MPKTKFTVTNRRDIFLYKTSVENLFINEFLPDAPGEYVKVFLFALMYAQYGDDIDTAVLAKTMKMTEEEVDEAWEYWEARGLIKKRKDAVGGGATIEFLRMIEKFYGKQSVDSESKGEEQTSDERLIDDDLKSVFDKFQEVTGRTISRQETSKLKDAIGLYDIAPSVVKAAIEYCIEIDHDNVDYMMSVARRWKDEGCEDEESVRKLLEKHNERNAGYREIFKQLGFKRLTNPADREIMDRWFDQMGCSLDEIIDACKTAGGLREPNLKYVNKVLENRQLEKGGIKTNKSSGGTPSSVPSGDGAKVSRKVLKDYYEFIREEEKKALEVRIKEASDEILGMSEVLEQENELNKEVASIKPGAGGRVKREEIREKRQDLEATKRTLLVDAGYPDDYLERRFRCNKCKDTGYTDDGLVCTCCRARADEAYMWIRQKAEK